jgi:hypothetical protein
VADVATIAVAGSIGALPPIIVESLRYRRDRERRREKRDDEERREKAEDERALRHEVLLMVEELLYAQHLVAEARQDGLYWDPDQRQLPTGVWSEKRGSLAGRPEATDAWKATATAYTRIDDLNWRARAAKEADDESRASLLHDVDEPGDEQALLAHWEPTAVDVERLNGSDAAIGGAVKVLDRLIGGGRYRTFVEVVSAVREPDPPAEE